MALRIVKSYMHPFMVLCCAVALFVAVEALGQTNNAVVTACRVQQRGLAASEHLSAFFIDWAELIRAQSAKTRAQVRKEPVAERRLTLAAIRELNAYATIQAHQPKHRSCP